MWKEFWICGKGQQMNLKEFREKIEQLQFQSENTKLQAQLDLAVEALRFYSDVENWTMRELESGLIVLSIDSTDDDVVEIRGLRGGKRARQALAKIKEMDK
jgi:hypothetical protein